MVVGFEIIVCLFIDCDHLALVFRHCYCVHDVALKTPTAIKSPYVEGNYGLPVLRWMIFLLA